MHDSHGSRTSPVEGSGTWGDEPLRRSVVICCYTMDRWEDLQAAVNEACRQSSDRDEVIVVVDHNAALLERCRVTFSEARVVENTMQQGLSGARNRGVQEATGDLVVFLDDDAVPEPGWLEALTEPFRAAEVRAVGGSAAPRWPGGVRPRWMPAEFDWVVGCTYVGMPSDRQQVRNVMGCNMAFHRSVFEAGLSFPTDVGRTATRLDGAEETALCISLTQKWPGSTVIFEPRALVRHRVVEQRCSWRYFVRRCFAEGRSKARMSGLVGRDDALSTERAYTMRVLPRGVVRGVTDTMTGDPSGISRSAAIVLGLAVTSFGYVKGTRQSRGPGAAAAPLSTGRTRT